MTLLKPHFSKHYELQPSSTQCRSSTRKARNVETIKSIGRSEKLEALRAETYGQQDANTKSLDDL